MSVLEQMRRGTKAENDAFTGSVGETTFDTDNNRQINHDGSNLGGYAVPNHEDIIGQAFVSDDATGTDTLTMTIPYAPDAYANLQKYVFKPSANNTGAVTLNVNSLGAESVKKKDAETGTLVNLAADDLIANAIYTVHHNGTDFVVESVDSGGIQSVSQGNLNTSTHSFSLLNSNTNDIPVGSGREILLPSTGTHIVLTAGQYGFGMRSDSEISNETAGWWYSHDSTSLVSGAISFYYRNTGSSSNRTTYGDQLYITSSPPFDLGDGDVGGFIFVLIENGEIIGTSASDAPPWGYNGKTDIRGYQCPINDCKMQRVLETLTTEQILDGVKPNYIEQEVTQAIKNADMNDIPHPFGNASGEVVLLDPMSDMTKNLIEAQNLYKDFSISKELVEKNMLVIDNEELNRSRPNGVKSVSFSKR